MILSLYGLIFVSIIVIIIVYNGEDKNRYVNDKVIND